MVLSDIFQPFVEEKPVCVMARGVLERLLAPECLDSLFERTAQCQYTRELLFSTLVQARALVACRLYRSPRAVYTEHKDCFEVTLRGV